MVWSDPSVSILATGSKGAPTSAKPFQVTAFGNHAGYTFPQNQVLAYALVERLKSYPAFTSFSDLNPVLIFGTNQTFSSTSTHWEATAWFDVTGAAKGDYQLVFGSTSDAPGAAFVTVTSGSACKLSIP